MSNKTKSPSEQDSDSLDENSPLILPRLIVTEEDTAEWVRRWPPPIPSVTSRIRHIFLKLDPPYGKISVSNLRWTRVGVLIAAVGLLYTLLHHEPVMSLYPALGSDASTATQRAEAVPVQVARTASTELKINVLPKPPAGGASASKDGEIAPTSTPTPPAGSLGLMGVGR